MPAPTFDGLTNFAVSAVATAPSPASSGTSLSVVGGDGARFPVAPFNMVVWPNGVRPTAANAEIVRVTGKATDLFTVVRAQEATAARAVLVGDQVAAAITAKVLTDIQVAVAGLVTVPTGSVLPFAGVAAPADFLLCDGAERDRTLYAALFGVIGTTYGIGNNTTTFNLPDLRGRGAVGRGSNAAVNALGASEGVGEATRSPRHNHTAGHNLTLPAHIHGVSAPQGAGGDFTMDAGTGDGGGPTHSSATGNPSSYPAIPGAVTVGPGGGPTDTVAYLVLNHIIKI